MAAATRAAAHRAGATLSAIGSVAQLAVQAVRSGEGLESGECKRVSQKSGSMSSVSHEDAWVHEGDPVRRCIDP